MVRGKKTALAARADAPTREPRARKAKETKPHDQDDSGLSDGDAAPAQSSAPRRSARARTNSQPPAHQPGKRVATRSSKRTATENPAESAEDASEATFQVSPSAKRQRLNSDSSSRSSPDNDLSEDLSPKVKRRRIDKSASKFKSSANPVRSRSPTPNEPQSPAQSSSSIGSPAPSEHQGPVNQPNNKTTSAATESISPVSSRRWNGKRRRVEEPSQPEENIAASQTSPKRSKRARFSPTPLSKPDFVEKENSEPLSEQAKAPEPPLKATSSSSSAAEAPVDSSIPASPTPEGQNDAPLSTPESPAPYPATVQEFDSSESRTQWKEPSLAPSLEQQLLSQSTYKHFAKLTYNMDDEKDGLQAALGEKRNLLKRQAPVRGRGRGRGRGGRGGRGGGRIVNGDHTEPSETSIPTVTSRGRGGYRVKKSENPYIQALYHRRAAIRNQYKAIGNIQRAALEALGEKSIEILQKDFLAHTKLPAFDQTAKKLGEIFDKTITVAEAQLKYKSDFYRRDKENKEEYERQLHHYAAKEEDAVTFTEFLVNINHIARQIAADATADQVPFYPSDEGFKVIRISKPKKVVALEGTPYGVPGDWPATFGEHVSTIGDSEYEQHPANFVRSIHPEDRKKYQQELSKKKRLISAANDKQTPTQRQSKSLLGPSVESLANADAPTPGEGSDADLVQDDDDDDSSDGDITNADSFDKFGVKLVNKPAPKKGLHPNNRFVVEPHLQFEDYEIGVRAQRNKRTNTGEAQYIGRDPNPNPKAFHLDQRATGQWNTAKFKPGDLDEDLVAAFNVHPVYGLAIPGCLNPTNEDLPDNLKQAIKPRSEWSAPLGPTQPVLFIEEDPASTTTKDQYRKVYHTSRSVAFVRARQIFDESIAKTRISRVLKEVYEEYQGIKLNTLLHEPVVEHVSGTPVSVKGVQEEEVMPSLLSPLLEAANQAKKLLTEEEVAEARMKYLGSAVRRYDPVRDEFTSSTYSPTSAPPPASLAGPPQPEDRSSLHLLANVAESPRFSRRPPPPTFHQGFAAPQAQWVSANHPHSHYHPQTQGRAAAGSSSLRQLRPAPPQIPPSPTSSQYRY